LAAVQSVDDVTAAQSVSTFLEKTQLLLMMTVSEETEPELL
jgi:hypothetical protein